MAPTLPLAETALQKLPALLTVWRLTNTAQALVIGAVIGWAPYAVIDSLQATTMEMLVSTLAGALIIAPLGWRYAGLRYARYQANLLATEGLVLTTGVLWQKETWVPIARLQHIDVSQGPLDRKWGMARLTLHTAGTHDHRTSIDGLPVDLAHAVRATLLPRVRNDHV